MEDEELTYKHEYVRECPKPELYIDHRTGRRYWDVTDAVRFEWEYGSSDPYKVTDLYDPVKDFQEGGRYDH